MKSLLKSLAILFTVSSMTIGLLPTQIHAQANDQDSFHTDPEFIAYENLGFDQDRIPLLENWKFNLDRQEGAQALNFDDSSWQLVSIPHDYSLTQDYNIQSGEGESGYKLGGVGWYRKHFFVPESQKGKALYINFDGVYNNASVYINGKLLGTHPYGYSPFTFEIQDEILYGQENVLAVKVNHQFPSSRWYSGSGIYRPVYLIVGGQVTIKPFSTKITYDQTSLSQGGTVTTNVQMQVENKTDVEKTLSLSLEIYKDSQKVQETSIPFTLTAKENKTLDTSIDVSNVELWDIGVGNLYTLKARVMDGSTVIDQDVQTYGYRNAVFERATGFSINGRHVKLQGVSMHHDQGLLGAKAYRDAIARQMDILMDMGVNTIRVTHNPAAKDLIELANEKGMMIIEEFYDTWFFSKNGNYFDNASTFEQPIGQENRIYDKQSNDQSWGKFDVIQTVKRDVNAPSVIAWSLGNELKEGFGNESRNQDYINMGGTMTEWVKEVDAMRPTTFGDNKLKADNQTMINLAHKISEHSKDGMGLIGFNYANGNKLDQYYNGSAYRNWILYASETSSAINSVGEYSYVVGNNTNKNYQAARSKQNLTSYDTSTVGWGKVSADSWKTIIERDYVAGEFVWTGFDYLGEPTPWNKTDAGSTVGNKSPKSSYFGIVDITGQPKDRYYFYRSQWNHNDTTLHILPAWKDGYVETVDGNVRVDVYTNAKKVKLQFKPQGSQDWQDVGEKEFTTFRSKASPSGDQDGIYTYQKYTGADKSSIDYENLYLTFKVPYQDGTLRAVAYDEHGIQIQDTVGRNEVSTYGEPAKVVLTANRTEVTADGSSLIYVSAEVKDSQDRLVQHASIPLSAQISGEGFTFEGMDNGQQNDHTSYLSQTRNSFAGRTLLVFRANHIGGTTQVSLHGDGLQSNTVTLQATGSQAQQIVGYEMVKKYYVKTGTPLEPLQELTIHYADGQTKTEQVTWRNVDSVDITKAQETTIYGDTPSLSMVSASVVVVDTIQAVLNYSTAVSLGSDIDLPKTRPVVLMDGTISALQANVTWKNVDSVNTGEAGYYVVDGVASIFGKEYPLTATVRVGHMQVSKGKNVAGNGNIYQDIPQDKQSDNLMAIVDGSKTAGAGTNSGNPTVWTNYNYAQAVSNRAKLSFIYDTLVAADHLDIYWFTDSYATDYPEQVTFRYQSDQNPTWQPLPNLQKSEDTVNGRKVWKYTFDPVGILKLEADITGKAGLKAPSRNYATGIIEFELYKNEQVFPSNHEVIPQGATLNGQPLTSTMFERTQKTDLSAVNLQLGTNQENVAVTKLEPYQQKQVIYFESEDHQQRKKLVVDLNQEVELEADNGIYDIPVEHYTLNAGSIESRDPLNNAIDGNLNTIYHSSWGGNLTNQPDLRYIEVTLDEPTRVQGLRTIRRPADQNNGAIKQYRVEVMPEGQDTFVEVASGEFSTKHEWQAVSFEPKLVKKVRLYGVSTIGDYPNRFISLAEIRIRKEPTQGKDLSTLSNLRVTSLELEPTVQQDSLGRIQILSTEGYKKPHITVFDGETQLQENTDYVVSYENCYRPGQAQIHIVGIGNYAGKVIKTYEIYDGENAYRTVDETNVISSSPIASDSQAQSQVDEQYQKHQLVVQKTTVDEEQYVSIKQDTWNVDNQVAYTLDLQDETSSITPYEGSKIVVKFALTLPQQQLALENKLHLIYVAQDQVQEVSYTKGTEHIQFDYVGKGTYALIGEYKNEPFMIDDQTSSSFTAQPKTADDLDASSQYLGATLHIRSLNQLTTEQTQAIEALQRTDLDTNYFTYIQTQLANENGQEKTMPQDTKLMVQMALQGELDRLARQNRLVLFGIDSNNALTQIDYTYQSGNNKVEFTLSQIQTLVFYGLGVESLGIYEQGDASFQYTVYPRPQSMEHLSSQSFIGEDVDLIKGAGIDDSVVARIQEAYQQIGVNVVEKQQATLGKPAIVVALVDDVDSTASQTIHRYLETDSELFEQQDSYALHLQNNHVLILGKDLDGAFYGATTLYHLMTQQQKGVLRDVHIEDYSDVGFRGFIEGYYGNPWSTQDRQNLMKWGGYYKTNAYVYAPKDDPKHVGKWRELYTPQELEEKITPLAKMAQQSHTQFIYTLHPFFINGYNRTPLNVDNYDESLNILKKKFLQVIEKGVRQIGILADDAPYPKGGADIYVRLTTDLTNWLVELKDQYPTMKDHLFFCPNEYGAGANSKMEYFTQFDPRVEIVMTGGVVWGTVNQNYIDGFYRQHNRPVSLWINWPCTDNAKQRLIMGGFKEFLHPQVNAKKLGGIVLNPMQQSEPSKVAIFGNADYAWNIWDNAQEADEAWKMAFNYVDHNSVEETKSSSALRQMSLHMINQGMDGRVIKLEESIELAPKLNAFRQKVANQQVTQDDIQTIKDEFTTLFNATNDFVTYTKATDLKAQMQHHVLNMKETSQAAINLLDAYENHLQGNYEQFNQLLVEGKSVFETSKTHEYFYVNHYERAVTGGQHIQPFVQFLIDTLSEIQAAAVFDDINPVRIVSDVLLNPSSGRLKDILDDNASTEMLYKEPLFLKKGNYFGLVYDKPFTLNDIKILMGSGKNHFYYGKLEYTQDGTNWVAVNDEVYTRLQNDTSPIVVSDLNLDVKGVRIVASQDNGVDAWITFKDFILNGKKQINVVPTGTSEMDQSTIRNLFDQSEETSHIFTNVTVDAGFDVVYAEPTPIDQISLGQKENYPTEFEMIVYDENDQILFKQQYENEQSKEMNLAYPLQAKRISFIAKQQSHSTWDIHTLTAGVHAAQPSKPGFVGTRVAQHSAINDGARNNKIEYVLDHDMDTFVWIQSIANLGGINQGDGIEINFDAKTVNGIHFAQATSGDRISPLMFYVKKNGQWESLGQKDVPSATLDIDFEEQQIEGIRVTSTKNVGNWWKIYEFYPKEVVVQQSFSPLYNSLQTYTHQQVHKGQTIQFNDEDLTFKANEIYALNLGNIQFVKEVNAQSTGLQLVTSVNGYEWENVSDPASITRAKYVGYQNQTEQEITANLKESFVTVEQFTKRGTLLASTIPVYASWGDTRTNGAAFDGKVATSTKFGGQPSLGQSIVFDLGRPIDITSLRMYVQDTQYDFLRFGVVEVSKNQQTWTELFRVDNQENYQASSAQNSLGKDYQTDSNTPNYIYTGRDDLNETGRYLRIRIHKNYPPSSIIINEIVINQGAYLPSSMDARFVAKTENQGHLPEYAYDHNLNTSYATSDEGTFSMDQVVTGQKSIKIITGGTPSNAAVKAVYVKDGTVQTKTIGYLNGNIHEFKLPENDAVLRIEVPFTHGTEIVEMVFSDQVKNIDKTALQERYDEVVNLDTSSWTTKSKEQFASALEKANAILQDEDALQSMVEQALTGLNNAYDKHEEKADLTELLEALNREVDSQQYTTESYENYEQIKESVQQAIIDEENVSVEQAEQLLEKLNEAYNGLDQSNQSYYYSKYHQLLEELNAHQGDFESDLTDGQQTVVADNLDTWNQKDQNDQQHQAYQRQQIRVLEPLVEQLRDYAKMKEQKNEFETVLSDGSYINASYDLQQAFDQAKQSIESALEDPQNYQKGLVDTYLQAKDRLDGDPTDYQALDTLLEKATQVSQTAVYYNSEQSKIDAVDTYVAQALAKKEDPKTSQQQVDALVDLLSDSIDALDGQDTDYSAIDAFIEQALDSSTYYNSEDHAEFDTLLEQRNALDVSTTSQKTVDQLLRDLQQSYAELNGQDTDYTALNNKLEEVEEILQSEAYLNSSSQVQQDIQQAIEEAKGNFITQEEVNQALGTLESALSQMDGVATDRTALDTLLNEDLKDNYQFYNAQDDKKQSYLDMIEEIKTSYPILHSQAEVDQAVARLQQVKDQLDGQETDRASIDSLVEQAKEVLELKAPQRFLDVLKAEVKKAESARSQKEVDEKLHPLQQAIEAVLQHIIPENFNVNIDDDLQDQVTTNHIQPIDSKTLEDVTEQYKGYSLYVQKIDDSIEDHINVDKVTLSLEKPVDESNIFEIQLYDDDYQLAQPIPGTKFKIELPLTLEEYENRDRLVVLHYHGDKEHQQISRLPHRINDDKRVEVMLDKFSYIGIHILNKTNTNVTNFYPSSSEKETVVVKSTCADEGKIWNEEKQVCEFANQPVTKVHGTANTTNTTPIQTPSETMTPEVTATVSQAPEVTVKPTQTPSASAKPTSPNKTANGWSILTVLFALLGAVVYAFILVNKKATGNAERPYATISKMIGVISTVAGVLIVLFFEKFSQPMVILDRFTIMTFVVVVINLGLLCIGRIQKENH